MAAISVKDLVKNYGPIRAVDGISFEVRSGEIFGLLGPNGAGKTTTIECLEGLRVPDGGAIRVLGLDPRRDRYELHQRIGVQLQSTALHDRIRVGEALRLFASLYRRRGPWGRRWERLLEPLGLADKWKQYYHSLSGGQKQRLHIALALVHGPELVFLDELTTGLDPQARRAVWDFIESIRERGTTVFLTTHYMEEAERLCDRVAILERGRILTLGRPHELIARFGGESRIVFRLLRAGPQPELEGEREGEAEAEVEVETETEKKEGAEPLSCLEGLPHVRRVRREADGRVVLYSTKSSATLAALIREAESRGWDLEELHVQRATLEDVFLALTGRELRE